MATKERLLLFDALKLSLNTKMKVMIVETTTVVMLVTILVLEIYRFLMGMTQTTILGSALEFL